MEEDDCKNGKSTFPLDYNVSNPTEFYFGKIGRKGPWRSYNPIHRRVSSLGWFDFGKSHCIMAPSSHKLYFWPTWRMAPSKLGYPSKQRCKAILKFWFHSSKVKNLTASKFFEIEILLYKSSMLNMYQKDLCQYLL